jgi:RimJ/RimL family protein N-acetyltransferase/GH25 family lysozyme M1 (1,4-beta-N-acetylmuramidase)
VKGIDVSSYQGAEFDFAAQYSAGVRFAYIKATEGSSYLSPTFSQQYTKATAAGMIRGGYHFANPAGACGATQATYFVNHGGGWSADGKTLPGVDIEYGSPTCYGLSQTAMITWIGDFLAKYQALTERAAPIYTTTCWSSQCTGNTAKFAANPLWVANYNGTYSPLPNRWTGTPAIWQYSSSNNLDKNYYNGTLTQLKASPPADRLGPIDRCGGRRSSWPSFAILRRCSALPSRTVVGVCDPSTLFCAAAVRLSRRWRSFDAICAPPSCRHPPSLSRTPPGAQHPVAKLVRRHRYRRRMSAPDLPVRTERLLLRRFVIDDLDDYYGYQRLPEVARFLYREPLDLDQSRERLSMAAELTFKGQDDNLVLAVQTVGSTRVIGEVVLKWTDVRAQQAEVGYLLHPSATGRGYATEATTAMLKLGFEHYEFHRIFARLDAENIASAAVCRRLGMRQEAHLIENDLRGDEWGSELIFAILRREWPG